MKRSDLAIASLLVMYILTTTACSGAVAPQPTYTPYPTNTPYPTQVPPTAALPESTDTSFPLATGTSCISPGEVTVLDKGEKVDVCGKIVNVGVQRCPSCKYGNYWYLTLEGGLDIISYDWTFPQSWIGHCVNVSDTVEELAGRPVFTVTSGDIMTGSKCTYDANGVMSCSAAGYFQWQSCP
jgi:hypothetical protein